MKTPSATPPKSQQTTADKPLETSISSKAETKIRAKFRVASKLENSPGTGLEKQTTITLVPVNGSKVQDPVTFEWKDAGDENTQFWKYTPSGKIELNCLNQAASDGFVTGEEYYIDFIRASPPASAE